MSDLPNGAASPAPDSSAAPAPESGAAITDNDVASVLVGLLDKDDGDDTPSPAPGDEPAADDAGADESPPTGDDEPGEEPEAPEGAPIEPPAGWTGKDRETWQSLPPAVQETIRRRDSEMAGAVTRATTERAEVERTATALLNQATQDRSQYIQNLEAFRQVLLPQAQQLAGINWQELAQTNPAEYVSRLAEREAMQQHHAWIQAEVQRIQQVHGQAMAQEQERQKRVSYQRLVEARPEFADPAKATEIGGHLGQFLRTYGFSDDEIKGCVDDRAIRLALVAMEANQAKTAVASANLKRTTAPAPQVQRPGSSQPSHANGSRRTQQLAERFEKSRSVEDAARIVATWLQ